jgi:phosphatidylinositol 4-kinase type 2
MQYFMHGFTGGNLLSFYANLTSTCPSDASEFLRRYPLPDRPISDTYDDSTHRRVNLSKRFLSAIKVICGRTGGENDGEYDYEEEEEEEAAQDMYGSFIGSDSTFHWTPTYIQEFREELEKYVS